MAGKTKAGTVFQCGGETETRIIPETWAAGLFNGENGEGRGGGKREGSGRGRNNDDCPAFMENSALYKDIYNNGLVNNKSRKRNFKIR